MDHQSHNAVPFAGSMLGGFLVCLIISIATGRKEAWDAGAYFSLGIPVMCAVIFGIAYRFPNRAWRWTLSMAVGQAAAIASAGNSLSLWPFSILAMTILSLPQLVAGWLASKLAASRIKA